jgi:hypothetical protein
MAIQPNPIALWWKPNGLHRLGARYARPRCLIGLYYEAAQICDSPPSTTTSVPVTTPCVFSKWQEQRGA